MFQPGGLVWTGYGDEAIRHQHSTQVMREEGGREGRGVGEKKRDEEM